jgi:hypothetical protein
LCTIQQVVEVVRDGRVCGIGHGVNNEAIARTQAIAVGERDDGRRDQLLLLLHLQAIVTYADYAVCNERRKESELELEMSMVRKRESGKVKGWREMEEALKTLSVFHENAESDSS